MGDGEQRPGRRRRPRRCSPAPSGGSSTSSRSSRRRSPVNPTTLVVGGGIAGIQAALELADAGYQVILVEREPSIGGHMAQFDKTFPTLDCSACILTPKMSDVGLHPNIRLLSYSEVEQVTGYVGNFTGAGAQEGALRQGRRLHRLRHLHREVPEEGRRRGLRGRARLPQGDLSPVPAGRPQVPGHRPRVLHLLRARHVQGVREVLPDERHRLRPGRRVSWSSTSATSSWRPATTCSTARSIPQYGYGRLANVFTSLEFERMCNAAGPTEGKIVLRDGVTSPRRSP